MKNQVLSIDKYVRIVSKENRVFKWYDGIWDKVFRSAAVALIFQIKVKEDFEIDFNADLDTISRAIDEHAIESSELSVLMMKRANNPKDRHSGLLCFPGGKIEKTDSSTTDCAIRETEEEIGISLSKNKNTVFLGELPGFEVAAMRHKVKTSVFLYFDSSNSILLGNKSKGEVAKLFLVPFSHIFRLENHFYTLKPNNTHLLWPCFQVDKQNSLWGVSHRILFDVLAKSNVFSVPRALKTVSPYRLPIVASSEALYNLLSSGLNLFTAILLVYILIF